MRSILLAHYIHTQHTPLYPLRCTLLSLLSILHDDRRQLEHHISRYRLITFPPLIPTLQSHAVAHSTPLKINTSLRCN